MCHWKQMRQTWPMRSSSAAERVAVALGEAGHQALAVATDVSLEADAANLANAAIQRFGRIDGLVNNAAVFQRPLMFHGPFEEMSVEEWDRLMGVNLRGVFLCTRAVVPTMKQQRSGKIVNISSGTVSGAFGTAVHYVTSKAGVIGFTRSLARGLGDFNINVNAIAPGATLTVDDDEGGPARREAYNQNRAIKRQEVPEDVVGPVVFLCSHDSDFVTGQTLAVNGGVWMH